MPAGSSLSAAFRPPHLDWLVDTGERLTTADGKMIEVWELRHLADEATLSAWAKHFRNHYCFDGDIDALRAARSRQQYLEEIKFPSRNSALGPSVRAGDFGEILIADYLQWLLGYGAVCAPCRIVLLTSSHRVGGYQSSKPQRAGDLCRICLKSDPWLAPPNLLISCADLLPCHTASDCNQAMAYRS